MRTITDEYNAQDAKCKLLHEWAMRFNGLDPANPRDRETPLTDDNPYVAAWQHAAQERANKRPPPW